jgi:hypothetical protein
MPKNAFCSLCGKGIKTDSFWTILPKIGQVCGHFFHKGCFDTWQQSHIQCPICKMTLFTCYNPKEDYYLVRDSLLSLVPATMFLVIKNLFLLDANWREKNIMVRERPEFYAYFPSVFKLTDVCIRCLMIYEAYRSGKASSMYAGLVRSLKITSANQKIVIKTFSLFSLKILGLAAIFSCKDPWLISSKILPTFFNRVTVVLGAAFMGILAGNQLYTSSGLFSSAENVKKLRQELEK